LTGATVIAVFFLSRMEGLRAPSGMQAPPPADWIDKGTRSRHNTQPMIALERVKMAAENANFRFSREAPQDEMRPGVHRRVLGTTERMMLTEFFLERGAEVPTHAHPHDQVGYVTAGRLALTVADDTQEVVHGDSYAIPGGVPHRAVALTDVVLVEVFAPPREDFPR
jgi:quercetin dioxygenase-like cupin family protein